MKESTSKSIYISVDLGYSIQNMGMKPRGSVAGREQDVNPHTTPPYTRIIILCDPTNV